MAVLPTMYTAHTPTGEGCLHPKSQKVDTIFRLTPVKHVYYGRDAFWGVECILSVIGTGGPVRENAPSEESSSLKVSWVAKKGFPLGGRAMRSSPLWLLTSPTTVMGVRSGSMRSCKGWIRDQMGWIHHQMGWIRDQGRWVHDQMGWVHAQGRWICDQMGWIHDQMGWIHDQGRWIRDQMGWVHAQGRWIHAQMGWIHHQGRWVHEHSSQGVQPQPEGCLA
eukprot:1175451-Prorocentrum_minimum.AAC.4